jgi:hypothetical protein
MLKYITKNTIKKIKYKKYNTKNIVQKHNTKKYRKNYNTKKVKIQYKNIRKNNIF